MHAEDVDTTGELFPENAAAAVPVTKPARKPRAKSSFVLFRVTSEPDKADVFEPLGAGSTDKALMKAALACGDGKYEVHYVRRKFTVATQSQTVIK